MREERLYPLLVQLLAQGARLEESTRADLPAMASGAEITLAINRMVFN